MDLSLYRHKNVFEILPSLNVSRLGEERMLMLSLFHYSLELSWRKE